MLKEDLIKSLEQYVRKNLTPSGFCLRIVGVISYNGKEYRVYSAAFSELPEDHGQLFFRLIRGFTHEEIEVLASTIPTEQLEK